MKKFKEEVPEKSFRILRLPKRRVKNSIAIVLVI
jgi:hypothetical protein